MGWSVTCCVAVALAMCTLLMPVLCWHGCVVTIAVVCTGLVWLRHCHCHCLHRAGMAAPSLPLSSSVKGWHGCIITIIIIVCTGVAWLHHCHCSAGVVVSSSLMSVPCWHGCTITIFLSLHRAGLVIVVVKL